MANKKEKSNLRGGIEQTIGRMVLLMLMYFAASSITLMLSMNGETFDHTKIISIWTIATVIAVAYNVFFGFVQGGADYEMLVTGNLKRASLQAGQKLNVAIHQLYKEYRPWKGFVFGSLTAVFPIVAGLVFGLNAEAINKTFDGVATQGSLGPIVLILMCISGWTVIPFYAGNILGVVPNYYLSMILALVPILVTGGAYIGGAYAKRAKTIRQQELADKEREKEEARYKKVNYGGLPGSQPKKKK